MKNFTFSGLCSATVILFSIISCKRDCHETGTCDPEYYRFELGEAKDYLWAGKGSYWIYKNTKTGDLDTQICSSAKTYWTNVKGTTNATKQRSVDFEKISRKVSSSFNKWIYNDGSIDVAPDGISFKGEYRVIIDRVVSSEGIISPFFFPFGRGYAIGNGSSNTICIHTDTSITIQGKTYDHVAIFELDMDDIWYPNSHPITNKYPNALYFWSKGIGLIKRFNRTENYSWELIEYNIIL